MRPGVFILLSLISLQVDGQLPAETTHKLDQFLERQVSNNAVPCVAAFVVNKKGLIYQHAAGNARANQPLKDDDLFAIYSMTKPVTVVALLQLVEQGKIGLDDPVSRYLPEFANFRVLRSFNAKDTTYTTELLTSPVTIRHLLTHTSGLAYDFVSAELMAIKKKSEVSAKSILLFQPGTRWHYGTNMEALGVIIEKVSGQKLDSYMKQAIFDPLGMKETFFQVPEEYKSRLVDSYVRKDGKFNGSRSSGYNKTIVHGAYGLQSTGPDYCLFLQCLLNGGTLNGRKILRSSSIKEMSTNQIGNLYALPLTSSNPYLTKDFPEKAIKFKFGFGSIVTEESKTGQRSKGSYGWAGILNTFFWVDPGKEIAVIVLMQQLPFYDEKCLETLHGFEAILYH